MKKQSIVKIGIILSIVSLLAIPAFAEIKTVNLHIDGLSCPFCALSLEKKLKKVEAIKTVDVHLKKAVTDVTLKPDIPFNLIAIQKAVKESGFTLRDIEVAVIGNVIQNDNGIILLESQGDKTKFFLYDENHNDGDTKSTNPQVLGTNIEKQLLKSQQEGNSVKIDGIIHQHANMPLGLLIRKLDVNSE